MIKKRIISTLILFTCSLFIIPMALAQVSVVTHPDNPVASLSVKDVKRIYLGKTNSYPNGNKAAVIDQKSGSAREQFYKKAVKKSESQLKAYWAKRVFTGKGNPPKTLKGDSEVKKWIKTNKNGLGYINSKNVDSSVKVLLVIP